MAGSKEHRTSNMDTSGQSRFAPRQPKRKSSEYSHVRKHFIAACGELVGTFLFLFFAFSGHQMAALQAGEYGLGRTPSSQTVIVIALSYGMSLLVTAWTMYRVSGGLFNPAVTLGMCLAGQLPWIRGLCLFPAQILGALIAAALVECMTPGSINTTQTLLVTGMSSAQGVFYEMFLTAELVFTVLMLAAEKTRATFMAPIGIGLALFVAEIAGVFYTGASLNPARSFAPCVVGHSFPHYHWIYWVGPALGAGLSAGFYHFIKYMNYEDANEGQDDSGDSA